MLSHDQGPPAPLELWGGIECTVNRVGDRYVDQMVASGHEHRPDDLDLIARQGIRTLRYPVLWERVVPHRADEPDWSWTDQRLARLRELGIQVIAGLIHHGSGPRYTGLLEPGFAEALAAYAGQVARRYPWLDKFTPVNEPLTTARFTALYGHWHPHERSGLAFARALLAQCRATVLSMQAIRRERPDAQLVQTEDLGHTHSTPALRYQADFENERRWLTFDLLCGRVDRGHPMAQYFRYLGVPEQEIAWFRDNPCVPDLLGINHYVTSERFLDERVERYPPSVQGSNGRQVYADVEAVRVCGRLRGLPRLLRDAWNRYQLPLAITEAHLGCTREEQLRWLHDVWQGTLKARRKGVDVRAVTVWSLLGTYDWDSLVTQPRNHYEPGAFDVRGPRPRPTALARLAADLAADRLPGHPVLSAPGWWRRSDRICYPLEGELLTNGVFPHKGNRSQPLLITGAGGTLGQAFAQVCKIRGLPVRLLSRSELDITQPAAVKAVLEKWEPWAVINAAGYIRIDDAERDAEACHRANAVGPAVLAAACARQGVALVTFSADHVFDGHAVVPYRENDTVNPLNTYGRSKAIAEVEVQRLCPTALILRTAALFGPWDRFNFVAMALRELAEGRTLPTADDLVVSPTYTPDLVDAALDLLIDGERGIWHLANQGAVTWAELAIAAARQAGLDDSLIEPRPASAFGWPARRPRRCPLGSERGQLLQPLEDALARYAEQRPLPARPPMAQPCEPSWPCVAPAA